MRCVWGRRWNAIARAEFRRHFGAATIGGMIGTALLAYAGAATALIWADDFRTASAIVRGITWICWILSVMWSTMPVQRMFILDRNLEVTEQWLLAPRPRREILGFRASGTALIGPLFIALVAPLYFVGAAGLSSAQYGLYALGHLARVVTFAPAPGRLVPIEVWISVPVALLAILADISTCVFLSFAALTGALQSVSRKRFWKNAVRSLAQTWEISLRTVGWGAIMIIVEGLCGTSAGVFCYVAWKRGSAGYAAAGLGVALAVTAFSIIDRLLQLFVYAKLAGRYHDAVLLEDDPGTRRD